MSIATEITRLQTAKASIKAAIENKGVEVPSSTTLSGYDTLISNISLTVEEIATDEGMQAVLIASNIGKIYKYIGITGTYVNGRLYKVVNASRQYLYKDGDECTTLTGGWVYTRVGGSATGTCEKQSAYMECTAPQWSQYELSTTNLINFSPYNKFKIEYSTVGTYQTSGVVEFTRGGIKSASVIYQGVIKLESPAETQTNRSTGAYPVITVMNIGTTSNIAKFCITKIWLESSSSGAEFEEYMETPTASIDITPSTSTQTINVVEKATANVAAMPIGAMGTVSANKSISGNTATITPSISAGTAGYNDHAALSGSAVTVTASEVTSGNLAITSNISGVNVTNYATVNVSVAQAIPIEISTDAGMTAVLTLENVGKAYRFTGTTGTYTNGDIYIVESV